MTFPVVETTNNSTTAVASTSHVISLPAGLASGNLLIICWSGHSAAGAPTTPTGWTELFNSAPFGTFAIYYRVSDGGEGASVTLTSASSGVSCHASYRISGYAGTPEVSSAATGTSTNGDPGTLTPSWGTDDVLWLAAMGGIGASSPTVSVAPTGYSALIANATEGGINDVLLGTAQKTANASSENPGTFTSGSTTWAAATIGVRAEVHSYVVVAAAGSFALTGQTAAFLRTYVVAGGAGSFSLSGQTAGLHKGFLVAGGAGSFSLTGQAASFRRTYAAQAAAGAFVLGGQTVRLALLDAPNVSRASLLIRATADGQLPSLWKGMRVS